MCLPLVLVRIPTWIAECIASCKTRDIRSGNCNLNAIGIELVQAFCIPGVIPRKGIKGLRDYLVQHLEDVEPGLDLYTDEHGIDGIEFSTPFGRIDILATDREDRFVVIELNERNR